MLYRCKRCDTVVVHGYLPTATCGLLVMMWLVLGLGIAFGIVERISAACEWPRWHWWISGPAGVFLGVIVAISFSWLLQLLEYCSAHRRLCPTCKSRDWDWGHTCGFGL